jgi:uncharacterized protein (TIGR02266 family)
MSHGIKRRSPRRVLVLEVSIDDGKTQLSEYATNFSEEGLFLATTHPLRVGQIVKLTISAPGFEPLQKVEGVVRWCLHSSYDTGAGAGIEFLPLNEAMSKRLREIATDTYARLRDEDKTKK